MRSYFSASAKGFLYSGGTYTELLPPGCRSAEALSINGSEAIVLSGYDGAHDKGWLYKGGSYTELLPPGRPESRASGINDSGAVVGTSSLHGAGSYIPFIYSGGTYTELLPLPPEWMYAIASGINGSGAVVGSGLNTFTGMVGFIYSGGTYTELSPPGLSNAKAYGINDSGDAVGFGGGGNGIAYVYSGGNYKELSPPGLSSSRAFAINNNGTIVGYGIDSNGTEKGFIATPVPEPSPPTAKCHDVTVAAGATCTATTSIDNGSYEPNGNPVTLTQAPAVPYQLGTTPVTLTVTDSKNPLSQSQCTGKVTVQDKTSPAIPMASVNPSVLWPPNHKMVDVTVNYTSTDNCGQPACKISGVTSNEPISSSDYSIVDAHHVRLCADRSGSSNGRIYKISIACTDASGNSSSQSVMVTVPHNQ